MKLYLDVDSQWFCEKLARDPSSSKGAKTDLKFFKINAMGNGKQDRRRKFKRKFSIAYFLVILHSSSPTKKTEIKKI